MVDGRAEFSFHRRALLIELHRTRKTKELGLLPFFFRFRLGFRRACGECGVGKFIGGFSKYVLESGKGPRAGINCVVRPEQVSGWSVPYSKYFECRIDLLKNEE